jgi:hypothetical protein
MPAFMIVENIRELAETFRGGTVSPETVGLAFMSLVLGFDRGKPYADDESEAQAVHVQPRRLRRVKTGAPDLFRLFEGIGAKARQRLECRGKSEFNFRSGPKTPTKSTPPATDRRQEESPIRMGDPSITEPSSETEPRPPSQNAREEEGERTRQGPSDAIAAPQPTKRPSPAGPLARPITRLQKREASMTYEFDRWPRNSTTTLPTTEDEAPIGRQPGAIGSSAPTSSNLVLLTGEPLPKNAVTLFGASCLIAARQQRAECKRRCTPAAEDDILAQLAILEAIYGPPAGGERAALVYIRLLGHLPIDILADAVERHLQISNWFPKPAELLKGTDEEIERRRLDHEHVTERCAMLEIPYEPNDEGENPEVERLQLIAASGSEPSASRAADMLTRLGVKLAPPKPAAELKPPFLRRQLASVPGGGGVLYPPERAADPERQRAVIEETKHFRLPDVDAPEVRHWLAEMEAAERG